MKKNGLFILALLVTISCEKNEDRIIFSGITETNGVGEILSEDNTDWNFNDDWNSIEKSLFKINYEKSCTNDLGNYSIIGYPNPCYNICDLHIQLPENKLIDIRVVDDKFNILISQDSLDKDIALNFNNLNIHNKLLRVYYRVYDTDCELNGHGDIKIN